MAAIRQGLWSKTNCPKSRVTQGENSKKIISARRRPVFFMNLKYPNLLKNCVKNFPPSKMAVSKIEKMDVYLAPKSRPLYEKFIPLQ